jgi:hypothetical protein
MLTDVRLDRAVVTVARRAHVGKEGDLRAAVRVLDERIRAHRRARKLEAFPLGLVPAADGPDLSVSAES